MTTNGTHHAAMPYGVAIRHLSRPVGPLWSAFRVSLGVGKQSVRNFQARKSRLLTVAASNLADCWMWCDWLFSPRRGTPLRFCRRGVRASSGASRVAICHLSQAARLVVISRQGYQTQTVQSLDARTPVVPASKLVITIFAVNHSGFSY